MCVLGELAEHDVSILELAAVKGMFSVLVDEPVSYVNAPVLATDRGVATGLATEGEYEGPPRAGHRECLLHRRHPGARVRHGRGVRDEPKLVEIDHAELDVPVSDHLLVFRYADRPGVVGAVGGVLGEAGVNIANMQVSSREDSATMVLTVDSDVADDVVAQMARCHRGRCRAPVDLSA